MSKEGPREEERIGGKETKRREGQRQKEMMEGKKVKEGKKERRGKGRTEKGSDGRKTNE